MFDKKKYKHEIDPDEIFLDARNLPDFNTHQFQGRFEKPIPGRTLVFLSISFLLFGVVFIGRLVDLQIIRGEYYQNRSENNHLRHTPIFSERGVIYDRNEMLLAWNMPGDGDNFSKRVYVDMSGIAHTLGYISYPQKDDYGVYYQKEYVGKDGVEAMYDDLLGGIQGIKITEVDVRGNVQSESVISPPSDGKNIMLSIDANIQNKMYEEIRALSNERGFQGGAGVIMDIDTGEILAMTSFPEYNSNILSSGEDTKRIAAYVTEPHKPFLNRAVSGLYTPGSTVKPFFGVAALVEGIIDADTEILSTGSISIQNPYVAELKTVFNDWKAHGLVDLHDALAVSSNVYFFEVGGGYEEQPGLGIERLERYARLFGLGDKTGIDILGEMDGVIPNPEWKSENFNGDEWRIGDTYNTAIGQYGFQITPVQLARAMAIIAADGKKVVPHLLVSVSGTPIHDSGDLDGVLDINPEYFNEVRVGMRQGVTEGIARVLQVPGVEVAAKTGTAEVGGAKKFANSWITGFFPYEHPRYSFAVVMEKGPRDNLKGAVFVMRGVLDWLVSEHPEYIRQ